MHKLVQEATRYALSKSDKEGVEAYFSRLAFQTIADLFPNRER